MVVVDKDDSIGEMSDDDDDDDSDHGVDSKDVRRWWQQQLQ